MMPKSKGNAHPSEVKTTFHERFDIQIGVEEAKRKFIHRVENQIFNEFLRDEEPLAYITNERVRRTVANALGERYERMKNISSYVRHDFARIGDFHTCLHALEAAHNTLSSFGDNERMKQLTSLINSILNVSEIDFAIIGKMAFLLVPARNF